MTEILCVALVTNLRVYYFLSAKIQWTTWIFNYRSGLHKFHDRIITKDIKYVLQIPTVGRLGTRLIFHIQKISLIKTIVSLRSHSLNIQTATYLSQTYVSQHNPIFYCFVAGQLLKT